MAMSGPQPLPGFPGVLVERDVPCAMRDGVTLMADVYRPADEGSYPVILIRLPYDKAGAENVSYAHPAWYARHGYIVVSQDTRGRYGSEGEWYPFKYEAEDGYDTIEWAAKLTGADGRVGMYGFSYAGATQMLSAVLRPPSLVTICPAMTGSQYYEGWTYNGGAFALAFAASWAKSLGIADAKKRGDDAAMATYASAFAGAMDWHWYLPIKDHPPLRTGDTSYFFDWLDHPTYDDYWRQWSIDEDYSRINVPALHIAGWYDVFVSGTVKNFVCLQRHAGEEKARQSQKLIIGPWYHIPWKPMVGQASEDAAPSVVDDWQLYWFDQFLKDQYTGVLDSPVTLFIMGEDRWQNYDQWPPAQSTPTPLFLHSAGRANSAFGDGVLSTDMPVEELADIYTYDPAIPTLSQGGHSCCFDFAAPMGPADQAPSERFNQVLVYTTDPLRDDVLLIGDVSVVLYAATTAVDTDWTARLCRVDEHGVSINLQEGIIRARFRDSLSDPTPIEPNRIYRYEIQLGPVGVRIPAGHRIRVSISSSDFPQWDRNMNTGGVLGMEGPTSGVTATQVVLHDAEHPSHVILPVMRDA
jgi:putative CocE/NonD family hydrolase